MTAREAVECACQAEMRERRANWITEARTAGRQTCRYGHFRRHLNCPGCRNLATKLERWLRESVVVDALAGMGRPLLRDEGDVRVGAEDEVDEAATIELESKPYAGLALERVRELAVETLLKVPDVHVRIKVEHGSVVVKLNAHGAERTGGVA